MIEFIQSIELSTIVEQDNVTHIYKDLLLNKKNSFLVFWNITFMEYIIPWNSFEYPLDTEISISNTG